MAKDVTINGLPILAVEPFLDRHYTDEVIGGEGSFMIAAKDFEQFGDAILRKLIAEIARVLDKGGTLILAAPFSFRLHEEPHDYFRYTPHGLRQLCSEAGLVIEHVEQVGSLWSLLGHKLNSYLAFHVARIGSAAQQLGKLGYESPRRTRPRLWVLPVVAPAIIVIAAIARAMDWIFFDREEAFGFVVVASHTGTRRQA